MYTSLHIFDAEPRSYASSVSGMMLPPIAIDDAFNSPVISVVPRMITSVLPVPTVSLELLISRLPLTVRLSSTVTVPPAESNVRFPDSVSISLSPVSPTRILPKDPPSDSTLSR